MYNIADYGIVLFNKNHRNNEFAGLSAGKLFDFVRVGIPVIASDSRLLNEFVELKKIGKVLVSNSPEKLNEILFDLSLIKSRALGNLFFDNDFESVTRIIEE